MKKIGEYGDYMILEIERNDRRYAVRVKYPDVPLPYQLVVTTDEGETYKEIRHEGHYRI